jgi:hypothetical protein
VNTLWGFLCYYCLKFRIHKYDTSFDRLIYPNGINYFRHSLSPVGKVTIYV